MTKKEYKNQGWRSTIKAIYMGREYPIASLHFPEYLLGLEDESEELFWVRCENVELVEI